jgi:hypothetical protein
MVKTRGFIERTLTGSATGRRIETPGRAVEIIDGGFGDPTTRLKLGQGSAGSGESSSDFAIPVTPGYYVASPFDFLELEGENSTMSVRVRIYFGDPHVNAGNSGAYALPVRTGLTRTPTAASLSIAASTTLQVWGNFSASAGNLRGNYINDRFNVEPRPHYLNYWDGFVGVGEAIASPFHVYVTTTATDDTIGLGTERLVQMFQSSAPFTAVATLPAGVEVFETLDFTQAHAVNAAGAALVANQTGRTVMPPGLVRVYIRNTAAAPKTFDFNIGAVSG